jgi:hypothetical protein
MLHFLISYYFTNEKVIPAEKAVGELCLHACHLERSEGSLKQADGN